MGKGQTRVVSSSGCTGAPAKVWGVQEPNVTSTLINLQEQRWTLMSEKGCTAQRWQNCLPVCAVIYPLGEPLYHHPECPPDARHNRAFILGLAVGAGGSSSPPHGDVPLISPLFFSAVTLGTEAAAGSSSSIRCSAQMFNRMMGKTNTCVCVMPDTNTRSSPLTPLFRLAWHPDH